MIDWVLSEELAAGLIVQNAHSRRDNKYIRVSGIGECRRKIGYRLLSSLSDYSDPIVSCHSLSIFELGHGLHLKLQERLSNTGMGWVDADPIIDTSGRFGWVGNCEIPLINHEHRIRGTLDALTRPMSRVVRSVDGVDVEFFEPDPNGKRYIVDIKTITARDKTIVEEDDTGKVVKVTNKLSSFEKLEAPKPEHVQQVSLYSWLTTQPGFSTDRIDHPLDTPPDIMVIYVAKDLDPMYYERHADIFPNPKGILNSPYKVFVQPTSSRVVSAMLKKVKAIWDYVDVGDLPARDYNYTPARPDYHCIDCPFRESCYSEEGYFVSDLEALPPRLVNRLGTM